MKYLLLFLCAVPLFAQTISQVQFEPPDPTSRTAVLAHVHLPAYGCGVASVTTARIGSAITIALFPRTIECLIAAAADVTVDLGVLPAGVYGVNVVPGNSSFEPVILAGETLVARDANPPFEVRPNTRGSGLDSIRLVGPDLGDAVAVHFGTISVEIQSASPTELKVKEPGFAPGTFDVTVTKQNGTTLRATAAYNVPTPNPIHANRAFYERVLLPVFWSGPGAFGAQWVTTATLYNGTEYTVTPAYTSVFLISCFPVCERRPLPKATVSMTAGSTLPAGYVEELPRQAMTNIDLGLNVRDTSRSAQDLGTEIPVVHESQLYARPFSIPNVPHDSRYRTTLRLYNLDSAPPFILRVFLSGATEPLAVTTIPLTAAAGLHNGGYAEVTELLPPLPEFISGPLRLEIDPQIHSGIRSAWGFVTVTNNETQHVTVISPQ